MDLRELWYVLSLLVSIDTEGIKFHWAGLFIVVVFIFVYELCKAAFKARSIAKGSNRSLR